MKRYLTSIDLQEETDELYTKGIDRGFYVGFRSLEEFYNIKLGCTTYIGGIPSHGKTEFHFELLLNLTEFYGWKHALFSPETGSPKEIIAELSHKYIRKPFLKGHSQMNENEKYMADAFLKDNFFILNPDENKITIEELLSIALEVKKEHGLNTFSIDPFNELKHDYSNHGGREDKYLEYVLGMIRRFAREHNVHIFIIAHPRTLRPVDGKYEPPTAFELSGGAAWYSKAETIICVYRPNDTNEANIIIQKTKPKHTGKKGTVVLFFDMKKSRYYEISHTGMQNFSAKKDSELKPLFPNTNFYEKTDEQSPF